MILYSRDYLWGQLSQLCLLLPLAHNQPLTGCQGEEQRKPWHCQRAMLVQLHIQNMGLYRILRRKLTPPQVGCSRSGWIFFILIWFKKKLGPCPVSCASVEFHTVQQFHTGDMFGGAATRNVWLNSWVTEVNGVNAFLRPQASLSLTCFRGRWGQGTKETKIRPWPDQNSPRVTQCSDTVWGVRSTLVHSND